MMSATQPPRMPNRRTSATVPIPTKKAGPMAGTAPRIQASKALNRATPANVTMQLTKTDTENPGTMAADGHERSRSTLLPMLIASVVSGNNRTQLL